MKNVFPLEPGNYYEIFGHTVGKEKAFQSTRNYSLFLSRYAKYVMPLADTYAYSILPKEYHFVVRINDAETIDGNFPERIEKNLSLQDFISFQFGQLSLSYTKAINKDRERKGALFMKPFRRDLIYDEVDLLHTCRRVHLLPVKKRLCKFPDNWHFSSFPYIINHQASLISKDISSSFNTMEDFIDFHYSDLKSAA